MSAMLGEIEKWLIWENIGDILEWVKDRIVCVCVLGRGEIGFNKNINNSFVVNRRKGRASGYRSR